MKHLSLILIALFTMSTWAADLTQEMDALGANKDLMSKAKAIDPHNRVRVVQNREVSRTMRLELGVNYGMANGGDPYVNSNLLGGQLDFHITPHYSIGARYYNISNSLNAEGKSVTDAAATQQNNGNNNYRIPGIDYAKDSWLVVGNWYPIYGKMSLLDTAVSQFDVYLLGGAGQIRLASGAAPLYTAGGGIGMWMTQHFATRLEARWQGYKEKPWDGTSYVDRNINQTILMMTVSVLL